MSSSGYAVPPYVFEQKGEFDAPFTFDVPATLEVRPDTASAVFDGTGAGGSFLACLTFYSPEGSRLCRMFNPNPVQAGDVAEVTFIPPFGSAASSSTPSGSGGIEFTANGVYGAANSGDALSVTTNGTPPVGHFGQEFIDTAGNGIKLETGGGVGGGAIIADVAGSDTGLTLADADCLLRSSHKLTCESDTDLILLADNGNIKARPFVSGTSFEVIAKAGGSNTIFQAQTGATNGTDKIGFFGVGPVVRQSTPVTLSDVIALLQAYGLST